LLSDAYKSMSNTVLVVNGKKVTGKKVTRKKVTGKKVTIFF